MSIISSEADSIYESSAWPDHPNILRQLYDSDDLREAYEQGASRQPTDEEIEAGAKAFYEALKPAIDKHDRQVAERAFELGCVAVDAEEHGVGCRFTVGQLEELSRDYGRDAYSVNNPYGRGES